MRRLVLLLLIVCLTLSTTYLGIGCRGYFPREHIDALGRVVRLDLKPDHIVSLSPSYTDILFALGLGDKVVGRTDGCEYPEEASEKDIVVTSSVVNLENIAIKSPDLILATRDHEKDVIPALDEMGLVVVVLPDENVQNLIEIIRLIGSLTGARQQANDLVYQVGSRIKGIASKIGSLSEDERPRTFYVTSQDPILTAGTGSIVDELIALAGGINIARDIPNDGLMDIEEVVNRDPEIIIAATEQGVGGDALLWWAKRDYDLGSTAARINQKVFEVNVNQVGSSGPSVLEGLDQIARLLHPTLFTQSHS